MGQKDSIIINKTYNPLIVRTILKRYWWWPLTLVFVFSLFAFFYLRYTKPTYESSMVLQLAEKDNAKDVLSIENMIYNILGKYSESFCLQMYPLTLYIYCHFTVQ